MSIVSIAAVVVSSALDVVANDMRSFTASLLSLRLLSRRARDT
jgi:hypothetical protein